MNACAEAPVGDFPQKRGLAGIYFFLLGGFSTLLIFNQIYIGTNVSLIWVGIIAAPLFTKRYPVQPRIFVLLAFLAVVLLKFALASNGVAIARYFIYLLFVLCCATSMIEAEFERFIDGFHLGLGLNIMLACVQMAGTISNTFVATFPVSAWNPTLWHYTLDEGLLKFLPRVPGFTQEPAYLGTLVLAAAGYRLLVQGRPVFSGWYSAYLLASIFFLVNSRTAVVGYCWLGMAALVSMLRVRPVTHFVYFFIYAFSFILLPIVIVATTDTRDLKYLADEDISVFARAVPLTWIDEMNNLTFVNYLVGVGNYSYFVQSVTMSDFTYTLLDSEGALLDSKSLGGAYFYDFGLAGLAIFIGVLWYICRDRPRSLLFVSLINIAFFNVYALSWPLYWLFLIACGLSGRMPHKDNPARQRTAESLNSKITCTGRCERIHREPRWSLSNP
jgi:hypothetical protein